MSIKILGSALATMAALGVLAAPANAAAPATSQPPTSSKAAPGVVPMDLRLVCAQSAWVRDSDLSHEIAILYTNDTMTVDRYVWKSTGDSEWAVGTAHTGTGDHYGYVEVYPSNPFC